MTNTDNDCPLFDRVKCANNKKKKIDTSITKQPTEEA